MDDESVRSPGLPELAGLQLQVEVGVHIKFLVTHPSRWHTVSLRNAHLSSSNMTHVLTRGLKVTSSLPYPHPQTLPSASSIASRKQRNTSRTVASSGRNTSRVSRYARS